MCLSGKLVKTWKALGKYKLLVSRVSEKRDMVTRKGATKSI